MIDNEQLEQLNKNLLRLNAALLTIAEMQRLHLTNPFTDSMRNMQTLSVYTGYLGVLEESSRQV